MSDYSAVQKRDAAITPLHQKNTLSAEEKINSIKFHFSKIMESLGLDLNDDSLRETPDRVAKMYVKEIFKGLDPVNYPEITLFDNKLGYNGMLMEKDITVHSFCEHHFVPIIGKAKAAYFPKEKIIGLSKINRLVQYFSSKPQVQENLTVEISNELKRLLNTENVAVYIEARHMCVSARGIKDTESFTITSSFSGKFAEQEYKLEFLNSK
jgi:GTP cyclohydrolase I